MLLKNLAIRTIQDRETKVTSLFVVILPETLDAFWIQPERLDQLLAADEGVVIDLDSRDLDGNISKEKTVVKLDDAMHFLTNGEVIGSYSLAEIEALSRLFKTPIREARVRETDEAKAILDKVKATLKPKNSQQSLATASR